MANVVTPNGMKGVTSMFADLHLHTTFSDGLDHPSHVVKRAKDIGFAMIAITDHDTVDGIPEAQAAARAFSVDVLAGTEISCTFDRAEVHVVGLGVNPASVPLRDALDRLKQGRLERAAKIIEKLRHKGVEVDLDSLLGQPGVIGRMNIARAIWESGQAKTVQHAFDKFLNPGKPAYAPHFRLTCEAAIAAIQGAGGLAFIAHPGIGGASRRLSSLLKFPFDGIEAYHSKHSPGKTDALLQLARERNLLVSGGSDCHGETAGKAEMGRVRVPWEFVERIREALRHRRA